MRKSEADQTVKGKYVFLFFYSVFRKGAPLFTEVLQMLKDVFLFFYSVFREGAPLFTEVLQMLKATTVIAQC